MSLPESACLAIDLGTTTIAASIIDCATGNRLALVTSLNPQRKYGADVVSRIAAAVESETVRQEMAGLVNRELETLAVQLLNDAGLTKASLGKVAIAGNPAMEHLLLGLPVGSLASLPYRPQFTAGQQLNSTSLGWGIDAETYLFPLPGGFVGGDLVAFLYGQRDGTSRLTPHASRLFLDLGTNAEIALAVGDKIFVTSAAAGPAFEGGNLSCGMPAISGAISSVAIDHDRVAIATIGDAPPSGLCGTGALTAIAALLAENVIDSSGTLRSPTHIPSNIANRVKEHNGAMAFVVHKDARNEILLTQNDIRQVQCAKGAIRAGIEVLVERGGIHFDDIHDVVITGSFGERLEPALLTVLGIDPGAVISPEYVIHGPLQGLERYLCTTGEVDTPEELSCRLSVVPLSGNPLFESHFIRFMDF